MAPGQRNFQFEQRPVFCVVPFVEQEAKMPPFYVLVAVAEVAGEGLVDVNYRTVGLHYEDSVDFGVTVITIEKLRRIHVNDFFLNIL